MSKLMNIPIFLAILCILIIESKCEEEEEIAENRALQDSRPPVSGEGLPKGCGLRKDGLDDKLLFSGAADKHPCKITFFKPYAC